MSNVAFLASPSLAEPSLRVVPWRARASAVRILPIVLFVATTGLLAGCSGTTTGTGTGQGTSGSGMPGSSSDGTTVVGSGGTQLPPGTSSGSGGSDTSSAYDALFDAPTTPSVTDDQLTGLWSGSISSSDVRLKLGTNTILIAVRCGSGPAIGVEVAARITMSSIKVLASKNAGSIGGCGIEIRPQEIKRCGTSAGIECFDIKGTTLSFEAIWLFSSGGYGPQGDFTKLSD